MSADILYSLKDWVTTSPAENLRNQYRELVKFLSKKITDLEIFLADFKEIEKDGMMINKTAGKDWEGLMITTFDEKQTLVIEQKDTLIKTFDYYLSEAHEKLQVAKNKLAYLENLCAQEDKNKREYAKGEINLA